MRLQPSFTPLWILPVVRLVGPTCRTLGRDRDTTLLVNQDDGDDSQPDAGDFRQRNRLTENEDADGGCGHEVHPTDGGDHRRRSDGDADERRDDADCGRHARDEREEQPLVRHGQRGVGDERVGGGDDGRSDIGDGGGGHRIDAVRRDVAEGDPEPPRDHRPEAEKKRGVHGDSPAES